MHFPLKKSHIVLELAASRRCGRGLASALLGPKEAIRQASKINFIAAKGIQEAERVILKDIKTLQKEERKGRKEMRLKCSAKCLKNERCFQ